MCPKTCSHVLIKGVARVCLPIINLLFVLTFRKQSYSGIIDIFEGIWGKETCRETIGASVEIKKKSLQNVILYKSSAKGVP